MLLYAMSYAPTFVKKLVRNEEGATLVEYGLLVALIDVVCVVGITALGGKVNTLFTGIKFAP